MVRDEFDSKVVAILFTDLVDSTQILEALGDEDAEAHRRTHFHLLRSQITAYHGREVKSLGDGLMVAFSSSVDAVHCSIAMQRAAAHHNEGSDGACLEIRIGIHAGEPSRDEDDYFGLPVVIANRLTAHAKGGQVIVSDLVRQIVAPRAGLHFHDLGGLSLKGIADDVLAAQVDVDRSELPSPSIVAEPSAPRSRLTLRRPQLRRLHAAYAAALATLVIVAVIAAVAFTTGGAQSDDDFSVDAGITTDDARILEGLHYRQELVYPGGTFVEGGSEEGPDGVRVSAIWSTDDDAATIFDYYEGAFRDLGISTETARVSTAALESLTVGSGTDAAVVIVEAGAGIDGRNRITVAFNLE